MGGNPSLALVTPPADAAVASIASAEKMRAHDQVGEAMVALYSVQWIEGQ